MTSGNDLVTVILQVALCFVVFAGRHHLEAAAVEKVHRVNVCERMSRVHLEVILLMMGKGNQR